MKVRATYHTLSSTLLCSVAAAALLTGCSVGEMWDNITEKKPRQTFVAGERHSPILNPKLMPDGDEPMAAPPPAPVTPAAQPKAKTSFETNPYDYYDDRGNRIDPTIQAPPPAPAPTKPQSSIQQKDEGNFFTRFYDEHLKKDETDTSGEPTVLAPAANKRMAVRGEPAVEMVKSPVQETGNPATLGKRMDTVQTEPADEVVYTETISDTPAKKNWLERTWDKTATAVAEPFEEEPVIAEEPAPLTTFGDTSALKHPDLASVPPTPAEFKSIKMQREQKVEDLKVEHTLAAQEKAALDAEPSQQQATMPVAQAPKAQPKPLEAIVATPDADEPVLLGHVKSREAVAAAAAAPEEPVAPQGQEIVYVKPQSTQQSPAPVVQMEAAPEPLPAPPAPMQAAAQPEPVMETMREPQEEMQARDSSRQPYWWEGWDDMFSSKSANAGENAPAPAPQQMQMAPESDEPVVLGRPAMEPEPVAAKPQPAQNVATEAPRPLATLPTLTPSAAPVAAVDTTDEREETKEEATTSSGLPSPAILNKVRVLPPSRYSDRLRSQQGY